MNYRTPLARARGLGSAREGSTHWWHQRATAVALVPLSFWLAISLARVPELSHQDVVAWLRAPWNLILMIAFMMLGFFHAMLGLQVIVEDYLHPEWLKISSNLMVKLLMGLVALAAGLATLRIGLVG